MIQRCGNDNSDNRVHVNDNRVTAACIDTCAPSAQILGSMNVGRSTNRQGGTRSGQSQTDKNNLPKTRLSGSLQRSPQSKRAQFVYLVVGLLTHCLSTFTAFSFGIPEQWHFNQEGNSIRDALTSHGSSQRLDRPGITPEFPVHRPARNADQSPRTGESIQHRSIIVNTYC